MKKALEALCVVAQDIASRLWHFVWPTQGQVAAAGPPKVGPFTEFKAADGARRALNTRHALHLNLYAGYYEVVEDTQGWQVVERRGRLRPVSSGAFDPTGGAGASH